VFEFLEPGPLTDGDLEVVLVERHPGDPSRGLAPAYRFEMRLTGTGEKVGSIALRIGEDQHLVRYAGHVGYEVSPEHRGNRYAARAVRMILPLARRHGLDTLWITCDLDNAASARTCELAGGKLVESVKLPEGSDMYHRGKRRKLRYRLDL
jgi:tagatose 1,6-diphosphate aldolase